MSLNDVLWAASFLGQAALLFILYWKKRAQVFPFFTVFIVFQIIRNVVLFIIRLNFSKLAYFNVYWSAVIPDYILQAGVIYEICRNVISPYRKALPKLVIPAFAVLVAVGGLGAFWVAFTAQTSTFQKFDGLILQINLGFSLLRCGIFAALTVLADALGLSWKHHVQRLAAGLAIYSLADLSTDALLIYFAPTTTLGSAIVHIGEFGYLGALLVWNISFFQNEPARGTLSPEAEMFLSKLHSRLAVGRGA